MLGSPPILGELSALGFAVSLFIVICASEALNEGYARLGAHQFVFVAFSFPGAPFSGGARCYSNENFTHAGRAEKRTDLNLLCVGQATMRDHTLFARVPLPALARLRRLQLHPGLVAVLRLRRVVAVLPSASA